MNKFEITFLQQTVGINLKPFSLATILHNVIWLHLLLCQQDYTKLFTY